MSIAQLFSIKTKQIELPDIEGVSVDLFSKKQWKEINLVLNKKYPNGKRVFNDSKIARFWFKLLQCKDLANQVPKSMIKMAYEKHRKALSTVHKTPEDVLQHVRLFARQFAEKVKTEYKEVIPIAMTTAPYECTRSQGGTRKALENLLVYNKLKRVQTVTRMDPVVIHLIGCPGVGKSFISEMLISKISSFFGIPKQESRYSRSMACEHWDGYRNQLIAQIDDIFTIRDGSDDSKQLIQMCSNAKWIVPMADLREKGREFNSEFLILSSNQRFQRSLFVNCDEAIDRRVYNPAFEIMNYDRKTQLYTLNKYSCYQDGQYIGGSRPPSLTRHLTLSQTVDELFQYALKTYRERLQSLEILDNRKYFKNFMPIVNGNEFEYNVGYDFDPCPNSIPVVKAHAIPEPLKVRMITKGESHNWILKPLQKAMFESLKYFPCFRLTSGQNILNNFKKPNSNFINVSGDYSAATDNLHSDVTTTIISELVKVLPDNIIPYVLRESSTHLVEYPKEAELEPTLQINGQLMGSLLSFPILCIANAATYGKAIDCEDLQELPCLINGDDIGFRDILRNILKWKKNARKMGLEPSVGKNYLSRNWFTINSQFIESKVTNKSMKIEPSEGFNILWSHKARKGEINTIRDALKRFEKKDVCHFLKEQLKRTPRSMDISILYGGLGSFNSREPTLLDCEINLMCYIKSKTRLILSIDEWCYVSMSKQLAQTVKAVDIMSSAFNQKQYPPKIVSFQREKSEPTYKSIEIKETGNLNEEWRELHNFQKFYKTVPELRNFIKKRTLIPLNHQNMVSIWIQRDIFDKLPKNSMIEPF
jgi:hypothetical protein